MSDETIVAVFETSAQADDAINALEAAGVPSNAIERHSKQSSGEQRRREPAAQGTGFFFWDMMFGAAAPHQDRPEYERSIERGETIIAVNVSEQDADRVMALLEEQAPLDLNGQTSKQHDQEAENIKSRKRAGQPRQRGTKEMLRSLPGRRLRARR